jgi:hypothetical protein
MAQFAAFSNGRVTGRNGVYVAGEIAGTNYPRLAAETLT